MRVSTAIMERAVVKARQCAEASADDVELVITATDGEQVSVVVPAGEPDAAEAAVRAAAEVA